MVWQQAGPLKEINLVLVETKRQRYAGSGGDDQALAYMGCVHQERKRTPGRSATVYGITTDSKEWRFLRINDQGEWALAICPYKAQVKRVVERFGAEGVQYHRCLTVDSAQGIELDTLEAAVLQRIAANARDLKECEVMWKRKWDREHL
ncbi:hypothetical protein N7513_002084 [Penicillium frequentans]|nr:hypothetical protein N7513_002084 [Penicillium glabrum]